MDFMEKNVFLDNIMSSLEINEEDLIKSNSIFDLNWVIVISNHRPHSFERLCRLKRGDNYTFLCNWHYDYLSARGKFNRRTFLDNGERKFRASITIGTIKK